MRADSFLYYSSKIQSLFDQGGEGRSEHTKGFCPPVCRALRCPSMEPGHRFAPRTSARGLLRAFRRRAPACLLPSLFTCNPQGASAHSPSRTRLDGLTLLGTGPHVQFPPLLCHAFVAHGGCDFGRIASILNG